MSRATASGLRAAAWLRKQLPTYSRLVHACNTPTHTKGRERTSAKGIVREVSALAGETAPFSSVLCVFISLRTTYTSIFPFSLAVTAVFTGSGGQLLSGCLPTAAVLPLPSSPPTTKGAAKHLVTRISLCVTVCSVLYFLSRHLQATCSHFSSILAGLCLGFLNSCCLSCMNFPCSKPREAVPAVNCIRQEEVSQGLTEGAQRFPEFARGSQRLHWEAQHLLFHPGVPGSIPTGLPSA